MRFESKSIANIDSKIKVLSIKDFYIPSGIFIISEPRHANSALHPALDSMDILGLVHLFGQLCLGNKPFLPA
jgi:hypothetical protein